MADIYRGVAGVNRKIIKQYRGVEGVNRQVITQHRGVGGVNRLVFAVPFEQYGVFGSQGSFQALADRFIIKVGSPSNANLFGGVKFSKAVAIGDVLSVTWACTYRYGPLGYSDAVILAGNISSKETYGMWGSYKINHTVSVGASHFIIGVSKKIGGTNQVATVEVTNIKLNGIQLFP